MPGSTLLGGTLAAFRRDRSHLPARCVRLQPTRACLGPRIDRNRSAFRWLDFRSCIPKQVFMGVLIRSLMLTPHPFTRCESTRLVGTSLTRLALLGRVSVDSPCQDEPSHQATPPRPGSPCGLPCPAGEDASNPASATDETLRALSGPLDPRITSHRWLSPQVTSGFRLGCLRLSPRAVASTAARLLPDERRDLG